MITLDSYLNEEGYVCHALEDDDMLDFFDCGHDSKMDKWLCEKAREMHSENLAKVWILAKTTSPGDPVGFFSLTATELTCESELAKPLFKGKTLLGAYRAHPALLLGKFALNKEYQGKGIDHFLMLSVYVRAVEVSKICGVRHLLIDTKTEKLLNYYQNKYDFKILREGERLYRTVDEIRKDLTEIGLFSQAF